MATGPSGSRGSTPGRRLLPRGEGGSGSSFVSGQVPRDPVNGELVGNDVESQTKQVMANVERALRAAGAELSDVVSGTVYLSNIDDWGKFNAVYKEIMPQPYPTRTALGADLRGILVEVSVVAYVG